MKFNLARNSVPILLNKPLEMMIFYLWQIGLIFLVNRLMSVNINLLNNCDGANMTTACDVNIVMGWVHKLLFNCILEKTLLD